MTSLVIVEILLNIFWLKLLKARNLLPSLKTSKDFLLTLNLLKEELDIDTNMTKNFMVYNFQFGGDDNAIGYYTYALIIGNYIDYIIRANYKDFFELPFVGTTLKNKNVK